MTEKSHNSPNPNDAQSGNTSHISHTIKAPPTLDSLGFYDVQEGLYNEDLEKSVLSSMMISPWALSVAAETLDYETFYFDTHKVFFGALLHFFSAQKPIDMVSLHSFLVEKDWLEDAGGLMRIHDIAAMVSTGKNIKAYIEPLLNLSAMRRLRETGLELIQATRKPQDPHELIEDTQSKIRELFYSQEKHTHHIGDYLDDYNKDLVDRAKQNKKIQGLTTGFEELDDITSGFKAGELTILAARPSMGKTALCLTLALNVAQKEGRGVLLFSLEMSKQQVVDRIKSCFHDVPLQKIQSPGMLDAEQAEAIFNDKETLGNVPIYINDQSALTCERIHSIVLQHQAAHDVGLIIVDYAQLIEGRKNTNRFELMTEVSNGLKNIAKQTGLPVVGLSQLSREVEKRTDKRPQMSDLRESGNFEQVADVVMLMFRPGYYGLKNKETGVQYENETELIVAKNRNGKTGQAELTFEAETTRFTAALYNSVVQSIRAQKLKSYAPPVDRTEPMRVIEDDDLF